MKNTYLIALLLCITTTLKAQNVYIPDPAFKNCLLNDYSIDSNGDNEIQVTEAENYCWSIYCYNKNITDLTGIEAFVNIYWLNCSNNQLTSLNLSKNTKLTNLYCENNLLTSLDLSRNPSLYSVDCSNNQLISLKFSSNIFPNLNEDGLIYLNCSNNQLANLDVFKFGFLQTVNCSNNKITSLDFSNNHNLQKIDCRNNKLLSLDIKFFYRGFDLLDCEPYYNNYYIDSLYTQGNPKLSCINVRDVAYCTNKFKNIDNTSQFSEHCNTVYIPDHKFELYLIQDTTINTNKDCEIQISEAVAFTGTIGRNYNYDFLYDVKDLTGIEAFVNITELICNDIMFDSSKISTVNLSKNTKLKNLYLNGNNLSTLDISKNLALERLHCRDNQLTTLDVSKNTKLQELYCENNQLTSLKISSNPTLEWLNCSKNQLTMLDVSEATALNGLFCDSNNLSILNLKNGNNTKIDTFYNNYWHNYFNALGNPNLSCIQVDDSTYSATNWKRIDSTASFSENCWYLFDTINPSSGIYAFPNPTDGILFFTQIYNAALTDLNGVILMSEQNVHLIDISNQQKGMYFLLLTDPVTLNVQRIKIYKK